MRWRGPRRRVCPKRVFHNHELEEDSIFWLRVSAGIPISGGAGGLFAGISAGGGWRSDGGTRVARAATTLPAGGPLLFGVVKRRGRRRDGGVAAAANPDQGDYPRELRPAAVD